VKKEDLIPTVIGVGVGTMAGEGFLVELEQGMPAKEGPWGGAIEQVGCLRSQPTPID